MIEPIIITTFGVAVIAVFTERLLESFGWFNSLPSSSKRLIAVLLAALVAFVANAIEVLAGGTGGWIEIKVSIAVLVQQVFHALMRDNGKTNDD